MHRSPRFALGPLLAAATAVLACEYVDAPLTPPAGPDPAAVHIRVSNNAPGFLIPADFLGLGFEMPVMSDPILRGDPTLERLLLALGPGTLRFGGNSVERTLWRPDPGVADTGAYVLTGADVEAVLGFARRIGWRVSVALNLGRYDPAAAADQAAYLVERGGDALLGIEIGNEPNLYALHGLRAPTWTVDSFAAEFDAYATAILARAPSAPIAGPGTWCTGGGEWFAGFLERVRSPLAFTSHHFYPTGVPAPPGSPEHATVENLLSPEVMERTRACVDSAAAPSAARGLPLRLNETNSAYGFGQPGVSDVFAGALWALDHLFTLAELGVAGVNVQTGTDLGGGLTCAGIYLPVCDDGAGYTARPLYYALLLFHRAARGRTVPLEIARADGANVVAHAVAADDGALAVVIINKEETTHADVVIQPAFAAGGAAEVLRLAAPSLRARDGVTLGGTSVDPAGQWSPGAVERVAASGGGWRVELPAASAALVTIGAEPVFAGRE